MVEREVVEQLQAVMYVKVQVVVGVEEVVPSSFEKVLS